MHHCFKLDLEGKKGKSSLARDKPGSGTPMLVGQSARKVLWSSVLPVTLLPSL